MSKTAPPPPSSSRSVAAISRTRPAIRTGKVLVLLAILLPTLIGVAGLVVDGGLMMTTRRNLQHAADAASTAAAMNLRRGKSAQEAAATARDVVHVGNELPQASVIVNIPPQSGPYAGSSGHVEIIAEAEYESRLMQAVNGLAGHTLRARSVAGVENAPDGAAIVVLDPDPFDLDVSSTAEQVGAMNANNVASAAAPQTGAAAYLASVPVVGAVAASLTNAALSSLLPTVVADAINSVIAQSPTTSAPALLGGLEVEGLGSLRVDGAILVNTEWGGVDENGEPAGSAAGPPYAVSCMPLLPLTSVQARDIRVVGGVDDNIYYGPFDAEDANPLHANLLPVDDPLASLPAPSAANDSKNVNTTVQSPSHAVRIALTTAQANAVTDSVYSSLSAFLRPLLTPLIPQLTSLLTQPTLQPGVYDSITVISPLGGVTFSPGVYIIRNKSPLTNMALCILGPVEAQGVMFYVTDSASYNASTGAPDSGDDPDATPSNPASTLSPSVLIAPLLPLGRLTGLNDPLSPFHGMLLFQRRLDRRPITIEAQQLIGGGAISGTIYSRWGHTVFAGGNAVYDLRFVTGTMRVVTITNTTIAPSQLLPPAKDVLLLE
jgi:hypothetical protein